jgi:D-alanyl-lipoteichoic acid acyltransferase DltB (MBOAT superfamily)
VLFNSIEFFLFLPTVLCIYWLSSHKFQNRFLLVASYYFYGLWDIRFLFLIVLSTSIDYLIGLLIDKGRVDKEQFYKSTAWVFISAIAYLIIIWPSPAELFFASSSYFSSFSINNFGVQLVIYLFVGWCLSNILMRLILSSQETKVKKKIYLAISVSANLSILAFFKYFDFFINSAEDLISSFGGNIELFHLNIILPVGISFYTFQTMSYSLDIYREKIKSTDHFLDFALFVAYFPQLVAGPIERASNLLPRILNRRTVSYEQITRGVFLIFWGLFKKIAIADGVAGSVNSIYNTTGSVSSLDVIFATLFFAIQIYCDFSAYSDIARGTSKLMGIELMRNFNLPYFSKNPSEFWQRWHISLSSWLRDYLYIPLGGNRGRNLNTYRNLMVTMLLGGLWHGAAWNYVLWGAYQGIILSVHRYFNIGKNESKQISIFRSALTIVLFFLVTCYGWLLFRATSFSQITDFTSILLTGWSDFSLNIKRPPLVVFISLPLLILYETIEYKTQNILFYRTLIKPILGGAVAFILLCIAMGLSNESTQFIYFQF